MNEQEKRRLAKRFLAKRITTIIPTIISGIVDLSMNGGKPKNIYRKYGKDFFDVKYPSNIFEHYEKR